MPVHLNWLKIYEISSVGSFAGQHFNVYQTFNACIALHISHHLSLKTGREWRKEHSDRHCMCVYLGNDTIEMDNRHTSLVLVGTHVKGARQHPFYGQLLTLRDVELVTHTKRGCL